MRPLFLALFSALLVAMAVSAPAQTPTRSGGRLPASAVQRGWAWDDHGRLIFYHGGPIMLGTNRVYVIYYGDFDSDAPDIIDTFLENLGGSGAYNVDTTYFDEDHQHIQNSLLYSPVTNSYYDHYSMGHSLRGDFDVDIIREAVANGFLPVDTHGIYALITSPDVHVPDDVYCGYHANSLQIADGHDIKYAVIPDPSPEHSDCSGNVVIFHEFNSPNDNLGADSVCDTLIHEISESVTDPTFRGWYGFFFQENADLCNFDYGRTFLAPNHTHANQTFGGRDYLVQTLWQNTGNGFCANFLPPRK